MNLTVETENSVYYIDTVAKTWKRAETNGIVGDQPLRTTEGTYNEIGPVELGLPLRLYCDPLPTSKPGTVTRLIETSPIVAFNDCRANTDTKQPQLVTSDLLTQILRVLVEIRDELKKTPKTDGSGFWPIGGEDAEQEQARGHWPQ